MLIKFFLLNILCLHWTFLCVDFLLHFFFSFPMLFSYWMPEEPRFVHSLQLICSALHSLLSCVSVSVSVCICPLLLADAVILITKPGTALFVKIKSLFVSTCSGCYYFHL